MHSTLAYSVRTVAFLMALAGLVHAEPLEPNASKLAKSLQLWLRADRLELDDGATVVVWPDLSGKGHDLSITKGVRPGGIGEAPTLIRRSSIRGRPAVRFDDSSGLAGSPDHPLDLNGDAEFTIFLVAKLEPNPAKRKYDGVFFVGNPKGINGDPGKPLAILLEIEKVAPGKHQLDLAGGWSHDASLGPRSAQVLYDGPHLLTISRKKGPWTAGMRFFLDGDDSTTAWKRKPTGTNAVPNIQHLDDVGVSLGRVQAWAGGFRGDIAELIIFNRELSEAERQGVEQTLMSRYGMYTPSMLAASTRKFTDEQKNWWAFQPVQRPPLPLVSDSGWPTNPIDRLVLAKMEANGLSPSARADRRTLLRRVTFDLIGLPPTPEAIDSFLRDPDPDEAAFGKVVDRLLASPQFGERWGRQWLDVVRYADTTANDGNFVMRYAWRYRDYVVDAFNKDKPYVEFLVEQLAGDLLPPDPALAKTAERIIATGFLMVGPKALAETDFEQVRMDIVDEQIDVTGRAFLGLTIACARCHDHMFDPIPTVDYYSLAGIFRSTQTLGDNVPRATMWMEYPVKLGSSTTIPVMAPKDGPGRDLHVHKRGNRFRFGTLAPRRFLQVLEGAGHSPLNTSSSGRLELARWIASRDNSLTARVLVNRLWQGHFGTGLVSSSDNFGKQGSPPSHPKLLDWLADEFVRSGWSMKHIHRLILTSNTYRQSSRASEKARTTDPDNRLLSHAPLRRLDAEQLRDSLLSVSGQLDTKLGGGELVMAVHAKAEVIDKKRQLASASTLNSRWSGFDSPRRSLYLPVIRNGQPDALALFDGADSNAVTPKRTETTVAGQAAYLLNNPFVRRQALHFARRILSVPTDVSRLETVYRIALGREPTALERNESKTYLSRYRQVLTNAGRDSRQADESAWQSLCQVLLCSNEFLYLD